MPSSSPSDGASRAEQTAARGPTIPGYTLLAGLAVAPGGDPAWLAREDAATGAAGGAALVVVRLWARADDPAHPEVVVARELDPSIPGPVSRCAVCGRTVHGWMRTCACGADLSGVAPTAEQGLPALMERVSQATAGEYEVIGAMPFAGGGGFAYFARPEDGVAGGAARETIVALRLHADVAFDDGTPRFAVSASQPLGVPDAPSGEPDEPTPPTVVSAAGGVPLTVASKASSTPLPTSILGSGLLAQQPTPATGELVPVAKVCPVCGSEYDTGSRFCLNDGAALRPKGSADPLVGRVIADRYHVLKRLGEGGMGRVYLGEHVKMNRQCAIKVMNVHLAKDAESARRFAREASNAARIIHPNVAAVFDYGEHEGVVYLVMEYVDGEPLSRVIERESPLPPHRALDIARQVAEGLVAAHELGIIHRDLKPDNIIIAHTKSGREVAKVVDFGIAKAIEDSAQDRLTRTGLVIGTPEYMSPEQLLGDPVDAPADIYSLGCILYQMLTGRQPFEEATREQMIKRRLSEPAPHPRALVPSLPEPLDGIVAKMLARSPQDRFASAVDVREALTPASALGTGPGPQWKPTPRSMPTVSMEAVQRPTEPAPAVVPTGTDDAASSDGMPRTAPSRRMRRRTLTGALGVGMVALLVAAGIYAQRHGTSPAATVAPDDSAARAAAMMDSSRSSGTPGPRTAGAPADSGHAIVGAPAAPVASRATPPAAGPDTPRAGRTGGTLPGAGETGTGRVKGGAPRGTPTDAGAKAPSSVQAMRRPVEAYYDAFRTGQIDSVRTVFPGLVGRQLDQTRNFLSRVEAIHTTLRYEAQSATGNLATVDYRLTLRYTMQATRDQRESTQAFRASLVRDGPGKPWLLQRIDER